MVKDFKMICVLGKSKKGVKVMATKSIKGVVICKALNFRVDPTIDRTNVLCVIREDETVRIIDESDDTFYKVRYTNNDKKTLTGYVMKTFIKKLEEPKKEEKADE